MDKSREQYIKLKNDRLNSMINPFSYKIECTRYNREDSHEHNNQQEPKTIDKYNYNKNQKIQCRYSSDLISSKHIKDQKRELKDFNIRPNDLQRYPETRPQSKNDIGQHISLNAKSRDNLWSIWDEVILVKARDEDYNLCELSNLLKHILARSPFMIENAAKRVYYMYSDIERNFLLEYAKKHPMESRRKRLINYDKGPGPQALDLIMDKQTPFQDNSILYGINLRTVIKKYKNNYYKQRKAEKKVRLNLRTKIRAYWDYYILFQPAEKELMSNVTTTEYLCIKKSEFGNTLSYQNDLKYKSATCSSINKVSIIANDSENISRKQYLRTKLQKLIVTRDNEYLKEKIALFLSLMEFLAKFFDMTFENFKHYIAFSGIQGSFVNIKCLGMIQCISSKTMINAAKRN